MSRLLRLFLMAVAAVFLLRFLFKMLRAKPYDEQSSVGGRRGKSSGSKTHANVTDAEFKDIK